MLEPRWVGKPTACAKCESDFVVSMLVDPDTGRKVPHVKYTRTQVPDRVTKTRTGQTAWANVTCECGAKIGLDPKFLGKTLACSRCGRSFIVKMLPRGDKSGDTAVLEVTAQPTGKIVTLEDTERAAALEMTAKTKSPPPPAEMHLLCVCGEQLAVPQVFYNKNMYCAGCGALMHLRLGYDEKTKKFELQGRLLAPPKGDE